MTDHLFLNNVNIRIICYTRIRQTSCYGVLKMHKEDERIRSKC